MEEVIKVGTEEVSRELLKNASVNISLEGWPCAVAVLGVGMAYIISLKLKYDAQKEAVKNDKTSNVGEIVKVA